MKNLKNGNKMKFCENMNKNTGTFWNIIFTLLIVLQLAIPVLGAPTISDGGSTSGGGTAPPLAPNLMSAWNSIPPDVQTWVIWIIGIAFLAFVVIVIVHLFGSSIVVILTKRTGSVAGSSNAIGEVFVGLGLLILVSIALIFILFVATHL